MAESILELIDDYEKRLLLGRNACKRAADFSIVQINAEWERILNQL